MEKEALLSIILQDIKELETLVNTFKGKKIIPDVFIQLSKSKTQGILDEIHLLASVKNMEEPAFQPNSSEKPVTSTPPEAISSTETLKEKPSAPETKTEAIKEEVVENGIVEKEVVKTQDHSIEPDKKKVEQPLVEAPKNSNNTTVIGELLGKDKPSFNERLQEKHYSATSKSLPPISDLRKAIGINDRFFFQRELFGGNTDLFIQTIDQLNNLENMNAALAFIAANFKWDPRNEAVSSFIALLRRRYIQP
jgi:hypothetical protein